MSWIIYVIIIVVIFAGVGMKLYLNRGADISRQQLLEYIEKKSDIRIIDVRSTNEYNSGHVPGAINIGHKNISSHLDELAPYKHKDVIVYCERGVRARIAQKTLVKAGFEHVYHLSGDMEGWRNAGLSMEKFQAESVN